MAQDSIEFSKAMLKRRYISLPLFPVGEIYEPSLSNITLLYWILSYI